MVTNCRRISGLPIRARTRKPSLQYPDRRATPLPDPPVLATAFAIHPSRAKATNQVYTRRPRRHTAKNCSGFYLPPTKDALDQLPCWLWTSLVRGSVCQGTLIPFVRKVVTIIQGRNVSLVCRQMITSVIFECLAVDALFLQGDP